jgi:hypothetical protein
MYFPNCRLIHTFHIILSEHWLRWHGFIQNFLECGVEGNFQVVAFSSAPWDVADVKATLPTKNWLFFPETIGHVNNIENCLCVSNALCTLQYVHAEEWRLFTAGI